MTVTVPDTLSLCQEPWILIRIHDHIVMIRERDPRMGSKREDRAVLKASFVPGRIKRNHDGDA